MTIPLSKLLTELLTDPDGRSALGDDPARVLADNGWEDLSPRDMSDALRVVTASGPAAAAHAGSELPEQPTSFAEVIDPVLHATTDLDSWDAEPGTPLMAGAIEPETYDFAPPPLVGVDPELAADPDSDPFLRSDAEQAVAEPEVPDETTDEAGELAEAIGLSFDGTEGGADEPTETQAAFDDLDADDGMTLRDAPGMDIADDLSLPEDDAPPALTEDDVATELAPDTLAASEGPAAEIGFKVSEADLAPDLDDELDISWGVVDPVETTETVDVHDPETDVDVEVGHGDDVEPTDDSNLDTVRELDPIVEVRNDVDTAAELDQGGPDHFDDLD